MSRVRGAVAALYWSTNSPSPLLPQPAAPMATAERRDDEQPPLEVHSREPFGRVDSCLRRPSRVAHSRRRRQLVARSISAARTSASRCSASASFQCQRHPGVDLERVLAVVLDRLDVDPHRGDLVGHRHRLGDDGGAAEGRDRDVARGEDGERAARVLAQAGERLAAQARGRAPRPAARPGRRWTPGCACAGPPPVERIGHGAGLPLGERLEIGSAMPCSCPQPGVANRGALSAAAPPPAPAARCPARAARPRRR